MDGELRGPMLAVGMIDLALGDGYSCALFEDGRVECWGDDRYGRLDVPGDLPPIEVLSLVLADPTCAIDTTCEAHCWGPRDRELCAGGGAEARCPSERRR